MLCYSGRTAQCYHGVVKPVDVSVIEQSYHGAIAPVGVKVVEQLSVIATLLNL